MAQIVLLVPLGGAVDPGFGGGFGGGYPGQPIYHPGHPDHGLPAQPGGGHPGNRPPGSYPGRPDQGLPGSPGHPSQGLPWSPNSPDNSLPVPPGISEPPVPPDLADQIIVLWHLPNQVEWHGKVIDPSLSAGHPLPPTGEPKY